MQGFPKIGEIVTLDIERWKQKPESYSFLLPEIEVASELGDFKVRQNIESCEGNKVDVSDVNNVWYRVPLEYVVFVASEESSADIDEIVKNAKMMELPQNHRYVFTIKDGAFLQQAVTLFAMNGYKTWVEEESSDYRICIPAKYLYVEETE